MSNPSLPYAPATATRRTSRSSRSPSVLEVGIAAFAIYNLATAALMVFAPRIFFTDIGPFGVQNDHYMRDTATFNAAFGVALAISYRRVQWRTPILCCVALEFVLHSLNHLVDIGAAHPYWLGPADFISLSLATVTLIWLARESMRPLEDQR
ncbi:MAG TPA: hypothetical protein VIJ33_04640 [Solirubrobacteraceae bacterium]